MSTSLNNLVNTMKHLGDTTSRNLEFSYRDDVPVSYGEETITESNLLELRRSHSDVIHLRTFSKYQESRNGADWEWYIIGKVCSLVMRVQAKRVQRNDVLRIRHTVGQTDRQQHDLLIETAKADNMKPMYCIYCTERQRVHWSQSGGLETGCLLVDAERLTEDISSLSHIESACWPWHLLFDARLVQLKGVDAKTGLHLPPSLVWDGPNIRDLNELSKRNVNLVGMRTNNTLDLPKLTSDSDERLPTKYKSPMLTSDSDGRLPSDFRIPMLTEVSDERLPVETGRTNRIEKGVKGKFVIDLRSLEP